MRFVHLALLQTALAVSPIVQLKQGTYQGTALANGITQWLGLRFARPPIGNLRFSAPQDPIPLRNGTQIADQHGPICVATGTPMDNTTSEDCLFLDVYAPTNASCEKLLPVYFFIQGGGFNENSNPNLNGSGLITAGGMDMVVVTINYRVGPYGFLASKEVAKGGSVNNGLKDQRKAMHWVQQNIRQFGGNPEHVVMGGDSAGAQSVNLHLTAYGGRNDGLFHATTSESQSFSALRTVPESQYMYDNLVNQTSCTGSNDTLACLRGLSTSAIQAVNFNIPFPGAADPPLYMYGPTLDFEFISDYTYRAYARGKFVRVPAIYGDDTNEGTIFVPNTTDSLNASDTFLHDQFPALTPVQLNTINALYPNDGLPQFNGTGRYWRQCANAYGEIRYICPGIFISNVYANLSVPHSYNYHWNVIDPEQAAEGFGVSHTIEVNAIWGPENTHSDRGPVSYYPNGTNAAIIPIVQAYWTSFIRTFDPNTYRLPGTPVWEEWTTGCGRWRRMMFQTNDTYVETVPLDQRSRCAYLTSIGLALKQ